MLNKEMLFDKIYGGWFGKCLGGAAGAPVEGIKTIIDVDDFTNIINVDLPNDDLDIQLLWLELLEEHGMNINSCIMADAWLEKCWYPFMEYGYFLKNYRMGIKPPYSGTFNNSFWHNSEGCPIRSEIWGFVSPNDPDQAAEFAKMDGTLDHDTNSVWAEMMLSAMASMVFSESDVRALINKGLKYVPEDSKLHKCIDLILECYDNGLDYMETREKMLSKYQHPDFSSAIENVGFAILALVYGDLDIAKTINIALKCGYDTDCSCATAAAIVGGILGYSNIPEEYKNMQKDFVCGIDVVRSDNTIYTLAEDTMKVALALKDQTPDITPIDIMIDYPSYPSIGVNDSMQIEVTVKNNTSEKITDSLTFTNVPTGFTIDGDTAVTLNAGEEAKLVYTISTSAIEELEKKNIITVSLKDASTTFGVYGANVWKVYGPYYKPLDKPHDDRYPFPHNEGCGLPTLECMMNNSAFMTDEYEKKSSIILNAYEDLIPLDEEFTLAGQCMYYVEREIIVDEDIDVFAIIGNSDGYIMWVNGEKVMEKDETRFYTPYNNYELIHLNKGVNKIEFKLLKRIKDLEFAFGLRQYDGEHWHKKEWFYDFREKCL